jgi:hypothetical protein
MVLWPFSVIGLMKYCVPMRSRTKVRFGRNLRKTFPALYGAILIITCTVGCRQTWKYLQVFSV